MTFFIVVLIAILQASFATSRSYFRLGGSQTVLDNELDVPGENPLQFCQSASNYSLVIQKVDLTPNPPEAGKQLLIEAEGTFTEEVEAGAYIDLSVKYGLITLINSKVDLCDQMKEVDEQCPLAGSKVIKKDVNIPKGVPPVRHYH
ncbi:MAG: hypothetical protein Q9163_004313 [Psora crenata]